MCVCVCVCVRACACACACVCVSVAIGLNIMLLSCDSLSNYIRPEEVECFCDYCDSIIAAAFCSGSDGHVRGELRDHNP